MVLPTIGPVEFGLLAAIALLLFGHRLIPFLSRRAGGVVERLKHADDDVREGLEEVNRHD